MFPSRTDRRVDVVNGRGTPERGRCYGWYSNMLKETTVFVFRLCDAHVLRYPREVTVRHPRGLQAPHHTTPHLLAVLFSLPWLRSIFPVWPLSSRPGVGRSFRHTHYFPKWFLGLDKLSGASVRKTQDTISASQLPHYTTHTTPQHQAHLWQHCKDGADSPCGGGDGRGEAREG
ncbi:hypothetical protein E2C01_017882 [Portunus trituberculatus]|uniref:Uncharacterized protein n=1 Tax=Portunus trituberculatus TaxID=210409 RepID=A0A5B7DTN2_PORTR|nr:hypothetical protein [Portunus trituberculatus]